MKGKQREPSITRQIEILKVLANKINRGDFDGHIVKRNIQERPEVSGFYLLATASKAGQHAMSLGAALQEHRVSHTHLYYYNVERRSWQTFAGVMGETQQMKCQPLYWMGLNESNTHPYFVRRKAMRGCLVLVRRSDDDEAKIRALHPTQYDDFNSEHKFIEMRRSIPLFQKL